GRADSRIDLNRTGTPLLEIVSQPDLRSPAEARAYLDELKLVLQYLGVSDCNMQEGSLRVDANVNLHVDTPSGQIPTPIVEIKNLNSFRAVERSLEYESQRQYEVWLDQGVKKGDIPKQTRGWDDQQEITRAQRHKEESSDYRYFPDPDLVPVVVKPEEVDDVRNKIGELPAAIRLRLQEAHGISDYDANVIVNQGRDFVDYFVEVAEASGDAKRTSNWIQQEVLRRLNELQIPIARFPVSATELASLVQAIAAGALDNSRGRDVFGHMLEHGDSVSDAMQSLGIVSVDSGTLRSLCESLLADNPKVVAEVKEGKEKAVGALIGQAKRRNPNVNPGEVRALCLELIAAQ
ncbi:MAG: Asp-tRNA(Asn)/Glu-tRNA(Gln) amidotransferase GatCAB subunit B, partial [Planctomycetaceae bacterium]|nr:Asp-tRNA(Asn)/Glu-tRNA(Gln) amidotransferase GatCAB subunit B [Planctomycetaceae bacterium]